MFNFVARTVRCRILSAVDISSIVEVAEIIIAKCSVTVVSKKVTIQESTSGLAEFGIAD